PYPAGGWPMRKLTYAVVVLILLVATAHAHAGDGRAFHSSRPVSPHAGMVSSGAVVVTHHPMVVARPHAFVGPRVLAGVGVGRPPSPYPYPAYDYPPPTVYAQFYTPPEPAYWYYCPVYGTYYPYVQQCPTQWLKVVPQPAP